MKKTARPPDPIKPLKPVIDAALVGQVAALVQKKLGKGTLGRLGDDGAYPEVLFVVPTGLPSLDHVFGTKAVGGEQLGMPLGKIIEIFGPESVGKTTLCKHLAMQCQFANIVPVIWDVEQAGVLDFDRNLGVDLERALGSQPDTMEEVFNRSFATIEAMNKVGVIGCQFHDSLAATPLAKELELGVEDEGRMAARAAFLSKNLPKLLKRMKDGRTGYVFINQVREKIGATQYQKQTYSPGGRAMRHNASVRLELSHMGPIKQGSMEVGIRFRVKAVKNRLAPPRREAELELYYHPKPRLVDPAGNPRRAV